MLNNGPPFEPSRGSVVLALGRIATELKKTDYKVCEVAAWTAELDDLVAALTLLVAHSDNAQTARTEATPELAAARQAWLGNYVADKHGVECVLRLAGKVHLMPTVFHDLAVPLTTQVTKPPAPSAKCGHLRRPPPRPLRAAAAPRSRSRCGGLAWGGDRVICESVVVGIIDRVAQGTRRIS
jgi:hypothetical protein